ncbi:MAG: hypothetical protein ACT4P3_10345 [Betaproteobacteria bacterium]
MSAADRLAGRNVFKRRGAQQWTTERIARLSVEDIKQLRENAERLDEAALAALCGEVLKAMPRAPGRPRGASRSRARARKLVARRSAFEARGVWLRDSASWGGVRKSDGTVVMALWADGIVSADGSCSYLLWRPNADGAWPWADKPAGRERLEHCKQALAAGRAEGLLVYGEALDGWLPQDKALTVHGVDGETVLVFRVELRGEEYWAIWGKRG